MGSTDHNQHHLGAQDTKQLRSYSRAAGSKSAVQQEPQLAQHTQQCRSLLAGALAWIMMSGRSQYTANYTASLFPLLDEENQSHEKTVQEKIIYVCTFMYFMTFTLLSTRQYKMWVTSHTEVSNPVILSYLMCPVRQTNPYTWHASWEYSDVYKIFFISTWKSVTIPTFTNYPSLVAAQGRCHDTGREEAEVNIILSRSICSTTAFSPTLEDPWWIRGDIIILSEQKPWICSSFKWLRKYAGAWSTISNQLLTYHLSCSGGPGGPDKIKDSPLTPSLTTQSPLTLSTGS